MTRPATRHLVARRACPQAVKLLIRSLQHREDHIHLDSIGQGREHPAENAIGQRDPVRITADSAYVCHDRKHASAATTGQVR